MEHAAALRPCKAKKNRHLYLFILSWSFDHRRCFLVLQIVPFRPLVCEGHGQFPHEQKKATQHASEKGTRMPQ